MSEALHARLVSFDNCLKEQLAFTLSELERLSSTAHTKSARQELSSLSENVSEVVSYWQDTLDFIVDALELSSDIQEAVING